MNNYTRTPRASRRNKKAGLRRTLLVVCMMLVVMVGSIAGTVAWLTAETDAVVNTFTTSDINITLTETPNLDLKMIPGGTITKDPVAAVTEGSEACWLFVEITEANNVSSTDPSFKYITYTVADGWTKVDGSDNIYYRPVTADEITAKTTYPILKDNQVSVSSEMTKSIMNDIKDSNVEAPTLTFDAFAHQFANTDLATASAAAVAHFAAN